MVSISNTLIRKVALDPHRDKRGFSWFPFQDCPELEGKVFHRFHFAELLPGAVRGSHYHTQHTEYTMLSGTNISLRFQNREGDVVEEYYEESPDILFIIPPGIAHRIENRGDGVNYLIGFFDKEGEVETVRL